MITVGSGFGGTGKTDAATGHPPKLLSIQVSELSTLVARVSTGGVVQQAQIWLTVDRRGLISGLAENPSQLIDEATAAPVMLSAIKAAFTLAARR